MKLLPRLNRRLCLEEVLKAVVEASAAALKVADPARCSIHLGPEVVAAVSPRRALPPCPRLKCRLCRPLALQCAPSSLAPRHLKPRRHLKRWRQRPLP